MAYAGTGFLAMLAYDRSFRTIAGLCLLSSALEMLQNLVPGRGPAIMDAIFSSAGGAAGVGIALLITIVLPRAQVGQTRQRRA